MSSWYKTAQSEISFQSWLGREVPRFTSNTMVIPRLNQKVHVLKEWFENENPNLIDYKWSNAVSEAYNWYVTERIQGKKMTIYDVNRDELAKALEESFPPGTLSSREIDPTRYVSVDPDDVKIKNMYRQTGMTLMGRDKLEETIYVIELDFILEANEGEGLSSSYPVKATVVTKDGEFFVVRNITQ